MPVSSVAETLANVIARRPVLEPILKTFEPLLEARVSPSDQLLESVKESNCKLPAVNPARFSLGVSILADAVLDGIENPLEVSAKTILPLLEKYEPLKDFVPALTKFFIPSAAETTQTASSIPNPDSPSEELSNSKDNTDAPDAKFSRQAVAEAYLAENSDVMEKIAAQINVSLEALLFATDFILAPVLKTMVTDSLADAEKPWEANNAWQRGYCPVCGSFPSISWLDRPHRDERNEFLSAGGGKKHLHCSLCGTDWAFRRGVCPACNKEGEGVIEIIKETDNSKGERIDWCTKCNSYCTGVDLRSREDNPQMDALALGLIHLDMIAADKKLTPLASTFWNEF